MAYKPVPPKEHQFKPGAEWRGNASGKPKQLLTKDRVKGLVDKYYNMSAEQLLKSTKDHKLPVIEITIAAIMLKCIEAGDFSRFDGMLSRAIGKVADEIIMPRPMVITRPSGEQVTLAVESGDDSNTIEGEASDGGSE